MPAGRRSVRGATTLGLALALTLAAPVELDAQLRGVPVLSPGRPNPTGRLVVHGLGGGAPAQSDGAGWTASLLASYLVGSRLTVTAGAGLADMADVGAQWQAMGSAAITVLRTSPARLMPALALASGVSSVLSGDHHQRMALLSLPFDLVYDMRGLFVEPFISPRVQARRIERRTVEFSQTGVGVSYGFRLGLAIGAALTFAVDHSHYGENPADGLLMDAETATSWALGFRLVARNVEQGSAR